MCNSIYGIAWCCTRRNINIYPPQVEEMYKVVHRTFKGGRYCPLMSDSSRAWKSRERIKWKQWLVPDPRNVGFCCYPKLSDAQECASGDWGPMTEPCVVKVAVKDVVAVYRTKDVIGEWQWVALVKEFEILEEIS
jgi:hypothetical protein